jgi:hypothetical protein
MRTIGTIALAIIVLAGGTAVATAIDRPPERTQAIDRSVIIELRTLNRNVLALRKAVGLTTLSGLRGELALHDHAMRSGIANIERDLRTYP